MSRTAPAGRKLPVIVNPHGHWGWKKQEPTVQSRLIGQALHGYLAIVVDSPGFSFEGDKPRRAALRRDARRPAPDPRLAERDERLCLGPDAGARLSRDAARSRHDAGRADRRLGRRAGHDVGLRRRAALHLPPPPSSTPAASRSIPNNGCLCNHVPGSLQIGDRADVLGLRAPAPVLIIGAEEDSEFPAAGMRLSGEKLSRLWGLFGRSADAWLRMFPGRPRLQPADARDGARIFRQVSERRRRRRAGSRAGLHDRAARLARDVCPARSAGEDADHARHRRGDVRGPAGGGRHARGLSSSSTAGSRRPSRPRSRSSANSRAGAG